MHINIDDATAELINDSFVGKLFNAAGDPIDASLIPSGLGYRYAFGNDTETHYDKNGHRVTGMWWIRDTQELELEVDVYYCLFYSSAFNMTDDEYELLIASMIH